MYKTAVTIDWNVLILVKIKRAGSLCIVQHYRIFVYDN